MNYGFKPGAKYFPLMVVLAVSMACQGKCPCCPYVNDPRIVEKYRDAMFMPVTLFEKIANETGKHSAWLRLSGREPLLHPLMIKLIEYAKKVGCKVALNTNGMGLDIKTVDRLLACNTDCIIVSVDAADITTYSKVRPGLDFPKLVAQVTYLKATRDLMKAETNIIASVVHQAEIKGKLNAIVSFWEMFTDKVMVRKYLTWGFLDPSQAGDPTPYLADDTPCPFPFERLNIDSRGDVALCGYDIAFDYPLGNIYSQSIEEVWQGEEFTRARAAMLQGKWDDLPLCKGCTDRKYRSWEYNIWSAMEDAESHKP